MKKELIEKIIDEFVKDKEIIKKNLIYALDFATLTCENEYDKITLTIKIEKKEKKI